MTSRRLHIHIGCHKTGTTSIQHGLVQNGDALAARGLSFFCENRHSGTLQPPDLHSWVEFVDRECTVPHGMRVTEPARLAERLSRTEGDIIVSAENFSFFFEQVNVDQLARHLFPVFPQIRIICYLRRQDRHIVSHHQEGSKLQRKPENDLFGSSARAIPPFEPRHELYLDYHRRLSMWAEAFGDENLVIRIFDRKYLRNGDAVDDFFYLFGIEDHRKVGEKNVSRGLQDIKIGHIINGSNLRNRQALVRLAGNAGRDSRKMLPARELAQAYYEHYVDSNIALNARFRVSPDARMFDEDFSDYPEQGSDTWAEDDANDAILRLLRNFDSIYGEVSPDDLRDAAIAVGEHKPEAAVRLLRIALMLRPDGVVIRRKLAEFEHQIEQRKE